MGCSQWGCEEWDITEGLSKAQHVIYILVFTDIYTFAHTLMCIICVYQIIIF